MHLARRRTTALLNALYDEGVREVSVAHPGEAVGELLRVDLADDARATVRFTQGALTYGDNRETVPARHGEPAYDDLPDAETYVRAVVASGFVDPENRASLDSFVERHGYPDLEAGHAPVVLGVDTNLMAWRLPAVLGYDSETGDADDRGRAPTNGYALATGVKEELDWHYSQYNTHELAAAFGPEFERLDDQPAGANREGFLGLYEYRRLRTHRTTDVVDCPTGDRGIVEGYRSYDEAARKTPILLSNDAGFVERATDAGLHAHRVVYPVDLPRSATGTWSQVGTLLYYLAVLFGVLRLPKATLYGVWNGKDGRHWQREQLDSDCRSPKVEERLSRALTILDAAD